MWRKINLNNKRCIYPKCSICGDKHYAKGYCVKHYVIFKRTGSPQTIRFSNKNKLCKIKHCNKFAHVKELCMMHYQRWRWHKSFDFQSTKGKRNVNWKGGIAEYPNHYLMKKNRLIILLNNPKCEICEKPATEVHHRDFTKNNHNLSNLMAICRKCNLNFHRGKVGRPKKNLHFIQK